MVWRYWFKVMFLYLAYLMADSSADVVVLSTARLK
jgi:hypothetical protein